MPHSCRRSSYQSGFCHLRQCLEGKFSHITVGTITNDAMSAEDWFCHSQHSCDRSTQREDILCHVWSFAQKSLETRPWNKSLYIWWHRDSMQHYREICSLPKSTASHEVWGLIQPVFHLCPPINSVEFPNPTLSQRDR